MIKKINKFSIQELLQNPTADYRPLPFWSWNDKLDTDMIRFQIQEMKKAGMGGFFMHARGGLETEYLSEDWMAAIQAGIEEAEKTGLHSWAYDEDGWPSGFAGGKVCDLGDQYHGRWLESETRALTQDDLTVFSEDSRILGLYTFHRNEKTYVLLNESEAKILIKEGTDCLVISHGSNPYYIDVLSEEVVGKFIEFTHEAYKQKMPENFDGRFKGFFTDEPRVSGRSIDEDFPWSYTLEEAYKSAYGDDLISLLPFLFFSEGEYKSVRYNFWKLVNHLFVHSFIKQLGDWCRANNSRLTGHIMMEESVSTQIANTGGVMPFYEFMDIPGIDWLRRTMSSPVVPKQVSSVAAQMDKKQILTESFALCGWNAGFEDLKWVAQWQYVNGVNLLCQHLEGYTIRGLRKRDYPPSLFIQQPWWDKYELFNTYFARLGVILSEGFNPVDVLVIHPMRSGWILFDGQLNSQIEELDTQFAELLESLSGQHIEYHLGDETILSRHGSVSENGLNVGVCSYETVIIPEMISLGTSTLDLLEEFLATGGKVISINEFPSLEEGKPLLRKLDKNILITSKDNRNFWKKNCSSVLSLQNLKSGEELNYLRVTNRVFEDKTYWYIINTSRDQGFEVRAIIPDPRDLFLYDPVEHSSEILETTLRNDERHIHLSFEPARSMILVSESRDIKSLNIPEKRFDETVDLRGKWDLKMTDPNVLTMDRCRYSLDGGDWQNQTEVIHLFNKLLKMKKSCHLAMEFTFESTLDSSDLTALNLVVELAEEFKITVNNKIIECDGSKWWKDSSFKTVDIRKSLIKGENIIILERDFYQSEHVYHVLYGENVYETEKNKLTFDVELENIYLCGDFAVNSRTGYRAGGNGSLVTEGPFYLAPLAEKVEIEDFIRNGFLFFSGKLQVDKKIIIEKKKDTRYCLHFGKPDASMIKVLVNGKAVKTLLWAPWEADISDSLEEGENQISLILYGSNRNMLGPHHHIDGEPFNVGPGSFTGEWSWVEKKSEAIPATKEDKIKNYWDEGYAFVPFGIGIK